MLTLSFPHLRDAFDRDELPVKFILRQGRDKARNAAAPKRRKLSAEARKKIADAQRRRWAKVKAAKKVWRLPTPSERLYIHNGRADSPLLLRWAVLGGDEHGINDA